MNRQRLKNSLIGIGVILLLLCINAGMYGFSFTPEQAMRNLEKNFHFGPSEIVYREETPGKVLFLGKYEDYICCYRVQRQAWVYWVDERHYWIENQPSEQVIFYPNYVQTGDGPMDVILCGKINDSRIVRLELIVNEEMILEKTEFHEGIFAFQYVNEYRAEDNYGSQCYDYLRGYDETGELIYETRLDP